MKPSNEGQLANRVKRHREQRGWSQAELAQRAGISRAAVSAIEIQRLTPSVAAALGLATALGCRVEDLFGPPRADAVSPVWAWPPTHEPSRYWHARVGGRLLHFPVEPTAAGVIPHDGVICNGVATTTSEVSPDDTLVMASCDAAAGLLVSEYARTSGLRLVVLYRSSGQALDLVRNGVVDVAGVHLATSHDDQRNLVAARSVLGTGFSLVTAGTWQEGLAIRPDIAGMSVRSVLRRRLRWVGRELGSGARQCQDALLHDRPAPRRLARDHRGVAEAILSGWADIGVCVRLASEDAGLPFIEIRREAYDLCFRTEQAGDPRLRALFRVMQSTHYRQVLSELPGYDSRVCGDTMRIA
jgi:molybdate-binding protein/transcriptional regulator with XRE-family HTH domain